MKSSMLPDIFYMGKIHPPHPSPSGMHIKIVTRAVHRIRNLEVPKPETQLLDPPGCPGGREVKRLSCFCSSAIIVGDDNCHKRGGCQRRGKSTLSAPRWKEPHFPLLSQ